MQLFAKFFFFLALYTVIEIDFCVERTTHTSANIISFKMRPLLCLEK
jgi:hypothetical protein